jgi:hypothetical protein
MIDCDREDCPLKDEVETGLDEVGCDKDACPRQTKPIDAHERLRDYASYLRGKAEDLDVLADALPTKLPFGANCALHTILDMVARRA